MFFSRFDTKYRNTTDVYQPSPTRPSPIIPNIIRCAAFSSTLVILETLLDIGGRLDNTLSNIIARAVGNASLDALRACLAFGRGSGVIVIVASCWDYEDRRFSCAHCSCIFQGHLDADITTHQREPGRQRM